MHPEPIRPRELWCLGFILAVGLALALWLIHLPWFQTVQYEEANPGLIALEAARGNFYPIYWGETYGGVFHAWVSALFFQLAGPGVLVFRLSNWFWTGAYLVFLWLLGRQLGGPRCGLLAAGLMAFPPAAAAFFGLMGWTGYVDTNAQGAALLWLVTRASLAEPPARRGGLMLLLAGVLGGLIIWTHLVGAPFLIAGALAAALARPRRFVRRDLWLLAAGWFLGAAPWWWFQLAHGLPGTGVPDPAQVSPLLALEVLFTGVMPQLLGAAPVFMAPPPLAGLAWWGAALLGVGLLGHFLLAWLPSLRLLPPLAGRREALTWLLTVFCLGTLAMWFLSPRAGDLRPRYLHTLAVFLPLLTARALLALSDRLARPNPRLGSTVLALSVAAILALHGIGLWGFARDPRWPRDAGRQEEAVIGFLGGQGYQYFLGHYRVAMPVGFMSFGSLVGSDFYGCQTAPYLPRVEAAEKVALVTHAGLQIPHPAEMEAWLRSTLGARFAKRRLGEYTVFYDLAPPEEGAVPLPPAGLAVRAGRAPASAHLMLDGDVATAWSTGRPQRKGDWLEVELGGERVVNGLWLSPGTAPADGPASLIVEAAAEGEPWRRLTTATCPGAAWMGPHPRWREGGPGEYRFAPTRASRLRLTVGQVRSGHPFHWTVAELRVLTPGEPAPLRQAAPEILALLGSQPPAKILTTDFWGAGLWVASEGRVASQMAYAEANSRAGCGDGRWARESFAAGLTDLAPGTGFVLPPAWLPGLEERLAGLGYRFASRSQGDLGFLRVGGDALRPLPPSPAWRARGEGREIDQVWAGGARFTPGRPQSPGQAVEVDLGGEVALAGLVLENAPHPDDFPRGLRVLAARAEGEWEEVPAVFGSSLMWWSGRELLAYRAGGTRVVWPARPVARLRLELTAPHSEKWWSLTRLVLLAPAAE